MSWTKQPPTETGRFWYLTPSHPTIERDRRTIVTVAIKDGELVANGWAMHRFHGHWWTVRIPEPPQPRFE